jgi:hypothetical protein
VLGMQTAQDLGGTPGGACRRRRARRR